MVQVLDKPPLTVKFTGSKFYLLAVSEVRKLYWEGLHWGNSKEIAKVFPTFEAAEKEQPKAIEKAPSGLTVIISPET